MTEKNIKGNIVLTGKVNPVVLAINENSNHIFSSQKVPQILLI